MVFGKEMHQPTDSGSRRSGMHDAGINPLDLVKLTGLMDHTSGRPEIMIGLIDGPVATSHPHLAGAHIREIPSSLQGRCAQTSSPACLHGTFVAGILCAQRDSLAPAICPDCTLLVRPIFVEAASEDQQPLTATFDELTNAIIACIDAGARVINLSAALAQPSTNQDKDLEEALNYAARSGVITVVAAGNQGTLGSSAITRHSWVIPVAACDSQGRPMELSNMGSSIGRRGLSAPGEAITSLSADGTVMTLGGTSVAAPFVTGAIALLWSAIPAATAAEVRLAVAQVYGSRRSTLIPPLLNAWAAYELLIKEHSLRKGSEHHE